MLEGKVIVVIGGGGDIGKAIARAFSARKAKVIIASRDVEKLENIAQQIRLETGNQDIKAMEVDVRDEQSVIRLANRVLSEFGTVDVLVNAHGTETTRRPALEYPVRDWDEAFEINARGVMLTCREFGKIMAKRGGGKIINISSQGGSRAVRWGGAIAYHASKGALDQITRAFAIELAPYKVNVNAIAPGWVETKGILARGPEAVKKLETLIPLGRLGKPEEIAELAVFLASPGSDFVTGQIIYMDGGLSAVYG
jgi:NAD(P)-dependent dehydrogenase (short-subunit alcohol dehydrogenase family)